MHTFIYLHFKSWNKFPFFLILFHLYNRLSIVRVQYEKIYPKYLLSFLKFRNAIRIDVQEIDLQKRKNI